MKKKLPKWVLAVILSFLCLLSLVAVIVPNLISAQDFRLQPNKDWNELFYEENRVRYLWSKEQVAIGEMTFLQFVFDLQKGVTAYLSDVNGNELHNKFFDFTFFDLKHREGVAEFVWNQEGEKLVDGLYVNFIDREGLSHLVAIEPMVVEVVSVADFKEEALLESVIPPEEYSKTPIILGILLPILFSLVMATIFLVFYLLKRKKRLDKAHFVDFFKNANQNTNFIDYYNQIIDGMLIIKQFSLNSTLSIQAERLKKLISNYHFCKNGKEMDELTPIQASEFKDLYANWIEALQTGLQERLRRKK